jgi:hypothetical protein
MLTSHVVSELIFAGKHISALFAYPGSAKFMYFFMSAPISGRPEGLVAALSTGVPDLGSWLDGTARLSAGLLLARSDSNITMDPGLASSV